MSRKSKAVQKADEEAILEVLALPAGRRMLWRELEEAGVFWSTFAVDPLLMAFQEGQRERGRRLLEKILELALARYVEMQREHQPAGRMPGEAPVSEPEGEEPDDA